MKSRPISSFAKLTAAQFSVAPRIATAFVLLVPVVDAGLAVRPSRRARRRPAPPTGTRARSRARPRSSGSAGVTTSRKLLPDAKLSAPNFCTMIVLGPSWLIESRSDLSKPRMSDVMPTIEVMPMTTPSTVSAERILFVRSVSIDIATISPSRPAAEGSHRCSTPGAALRSDRAPRPASPDTGRRTGRRAAVIPIPITTDHT